MAKTKTNPDTKPAALFEVPETIYNLHFEDYDGLIVKLRSMTLGGMWDSVDMAELEPLLKSGEITQPQNVGKLKEIRRLFDFLADAIVEWNLSKNGQVLPITVETFDGLPSDLAFNILGEAYQVMVGVSTPLEQPSGDGGQLEALPIPMEAS